MKMYRVYISLPISMPRPTPLPTITTETSVIWGVTRKWHRNTIKRNAFFEVIWGWTSKWGVRLLPLSWLGVGVEIGWLVRGSFQNNVGSDFGFGQRPLTGVPNDINPGHLELSPLRTCNKHPAKVSFFVVRQFFNTIKRMSDRSCIILGPKNDQKLKSKFCGFGVRSHSSSRPIGPRLKLFVRLVGWTNI